MSEWIRIEDRMPSAGQYIFQTKRDGMCIAFIYERDIKYKKPEVFYKNKGCQITHWMPLPPKPDKD